MRPEPVSGRERLWVAALLVVAFAARLAFVLRQEAGFYFEDSLDYDGAARAFLTDGSFGPRYYRSPLYPLLLAACYRLFGFSLTPFRVVQALLVVGLCACVWVLARRAFGARAARIALAGAALFPVFIVLPGIEYPMVPGTLLIWVAFLLFARRDGEEARGAGRMAAAGIAAGLSVMFFEGGLAAVLFLLLWALVARRPWRARLRDAAVTGAACLAALLPWLGSMVRAHDYRPLVLRAGIHLPAAPGETPPVWEGSGENLLKSKMGALFRHPGWSARYVAREFLHFWNPYPDRLVTADPEFRRALNRKDPRMVVENPMVGDRARLLYAAGYGTLLAAAGAGGLVALRATPGAAFLIAWPVVLGLCYAPFFTQMRYRIPADPAFLLLGAFALDLALRGTLGREMRGSLLAAWDGWKRIAHKIATAQTFLLLFLLFALVLGPIGLLMRLFRKDPMAAPRAPGSLWNLRERTREGMTECLRQF
jgi:4-amino-4-deoxy-L-arabinose transferase-like glycosyltransferase